VETLLFKRMYQGLSALVTRLFPQPEPLIFLAALSGGADSVALARLMARLQQDFPVTVKAVHIHHGLRGKDADDDALFCVDLCRELDIESIVRYAAGLKPGSGIETRAREARYALFQDVYTQTRAGALFLAHHLNDRAETLLLNFMRGSGGRGMGAMREDTVRDGMRIIRPLLTVPRADIEALGFPHREDASNYLPDNPRNALRLTVFPELERLAPGTAARMASAAETAATEDDYLSGLTAGLNADTAFIPLDTLTDMHPALRRRALRAFVGVPIHFQATLALEALIYGKPGAKMVISRGLCIERGYRHLFAPDRMTPVEARLTAAPCPPGVTGDGLRTQALPEQLYRRAELRPKQAGDTIRPFGMKGRKSMQDFFTDLKVDRPFRAVIPILCLGSEVLWVPGLGAGSAVYIKPDDKGVLLTSEFPMPWQR